MGKHPEADLSKVRTFSVRTRGSLVRADQRARPVGPDATVLQLLESLPDQLAARQLRTLVAALVAARQADAPVVLAAGAHVIKLGLGPLLIDLLERRLLTALVLNGAGVIHDVELGLFGETSEDVASELDDGRFGFADETARFLNEAVNGGAARQLGFGEAVGESLLAQAGPHAGLSVIRAAHRLGVPITVHVALGTDIVHQHPSADGAAIGAASLRDFRVLVEVVRRLSGGVWINAGSAVLLPEVFLKALSVARNLYGPIEGFTTADLDMLRHYRPRVNVVERPTRRGGSEGISITGHHEILLPLLCAAVKARWAETAPRGAPGVEPGPP